MKQHEKASVDADEADSRPIVLVSTLRAKLARAGVDGLIETRRGFGYVVV